MKEFVYVYGTKVSTQSFIIAIAGTIFCLLALYFFPKLLNYIVLIYASILLQAYNVNCSIVGQCKTWATMLAILFCVKMLYVIYFVSNVGPSKFGKSLEYVLEKRQNAKII
jgi:hypothetical protein